MQILCVCADTQVNCFMEITHVKDLQRKIEKGNFLPVTDVAAGAIKLN